MKKLIILLLLSSGVWAQTTVTFPKSGTVATQEWVLEQLGQKPPVAVIGDCPHGPDIKDVYGITKTEFTLLFDANDVTPIQWKVSNMGDTAAIVRGVVTPTMNHPTIQFGKSLSAKAYRLWIDGVTCKNKKGVAPYTFTVPGSTGVVDPPVIVVPPITQPTGLIKELVLNYNGEGFTSKGTVGIVGEGSYIDEFKMPDGSYVVTGIRLAIPWYEWETSPGVYSTEKLKSVISFVRARGLSLSFCFLPWRKYGDGFIRPDQMVKGNLGDIMYPVDIVAGEPKYNSVLASMADESVNVQIFNAVKALSQGLDAYENAGNISLGTARAEEFIITNFHAKRPGVEHILQLADFSDAFQSKFRAFRDSRGLATGGPEISTDGYLNMGNEIGREYARFCAVMMRKYFDNFTAAVRAGSGKVRSCYYMPSVGTHQNGMELGAYFAYIAKNADQWYHTDGSTGYDNDRKLIGVAVGRGTFPNKLISFEIDPEDASSINGSTINARQFADLVKAGLKQGAYSCHVALHFNPSSVAAIKSIAQELRDAGIGKPFSPEPVTDGNTVTTDITKKVWNNEWLYDDIFYRDRNKYIKQVAPGFFGNSSIGTGN